MVANDNDEAVALALKDAVALYDRGDYAAAILIPRPLTEQGNARAQGILGTMYGLGQGVPRDYGVAWDWLYPSAEAGDANAQYNLGTLYERGLGVPRDNQEAIKWFRLAAFQNVPEAQFGLGVFFDEGRGVPVDFVQAHAWHQVAAAQSFTPDVRDKAVVELDLVSAKMTQEQVAEANKLAQELRKAIAGFQSVSDEDDPPQH